MHNKQYQYNIEMQSQKFNIEIQRYKVQNYEGVCNTYRSKLRAVKCKHCINCIYINKTKSNIYIYDINVQ